MNFSDEQFKDLEEKLKVTDETKDKIRREILHNAHKNKKRNLKYFGWIAVACMLFIITSPFYSKTMASIAEKVLPISITSSFSDGQHNPDLTSQLFDLVEKEGYTVNFVGITLSPYTIEISLILKGATLKQARDELEPIIANYLYENGYDRYELKVSKATEASQKYRENKTNGLHDKVSKIVKEVFAAYGYAEEADYELTGLTKSWFSNTVTVDMPDHIQESTEIIADIEKEIKSQNLDVKDVEVYTFNMEHYLQDSRWTPIVSDISNAMSGKSTYQLAGVSYKVKKGHSYVWIKTDWDHPPSDEVIQDIKLAIQNYLSLPDVKERIQNDQYTIQLLLKSGDPFVEIKN